MRVGVAQNERQIRIQKKYSNDVFPSGSSSVTIDSHTGKVITVQKVLKPTVGHRVAKLISDLHFGTFGGLTSKIIDVFVGFSPIVLFLTGFAIFQQK